VVAVSGMTVRSALATKAEQKVLPARERMETAGASGNVIRRRRIIAEKKANLSGWLVGEQKRRKRTRPRVLRSCPRSKRIRLRAEPPLRAVTPQIVMEAGVECRLLIAGVEVEAKEEAIKKLRRREGLLQIQKAVDQNQDPNQNLDQDPEADPNPALEVAPVALVPDPVANPDQGLNPAVNPAPDPGHEVNLAQDPNPAVNPAPEVGRRPRVRPGPDPVHRQDLNLDPDHLKKKDHHHNLLNCVYLSTGIFCIYLYNVK